MSAIDMLGELYLYYGWSGLKAIRIRNTTRFEIQKNFIHHEGDNI